MTWDWVNEDRMHSIQRSIFCSQLHWPMVPLPSKSTRISTNPPTAVRVEVEADIHCLLPLPPSPPPCTPETPEKLPEEAGNLAGADAWSKTLGKRKGNSQEQSHTLIEVATEAPSKKPGGYFTAPAQPDPDDQFIIPPELEEEVKEIMKQHQQDQQKPDKSERPADYYDTPLWRSRCILSSSTQPDLVGFNPVLERRAGWYKK